MEIAFSYPPDIDNNNSVEMSNFLHFHTVFCIHPGPISKTVEAFSWAGEHKIR